MKKLLTILSICLLSFNLNAQDSTKLNVGLIYSDVKAGFTKLVNSLEGPAKHTYKVFVYQNKVEAVSNLIAVLIPLIIGILLIILCLKKSNFGEEDWNRYATLTIAGLIMSFVSILFLVFFFTEGGFVKLLNPEYYAIKDVINIFK